MLRAALSRAASARSAVSLDNRLVRLLETKSDITGAARCQTVRNPFIYQLRQLAGPHDQSRLPESSQPVPTNHELASKGVQSEEEKPVLSMEQSTMVALETKGIKQPKRPDVQALASSFLGGAYLSWGSMLMFHVGGGSSAVLAPGLLAAVKGMVFPIGLSMIVLSGSELMTGNFLTQSLPSLKETPLAHRAKTIALSGVGNLAGSLTMVAGVVAVGLFPHGSLSAGHAVAIATGKCSAPLLTAFLKGVGANWLVGVAIFQATAVQSAAGKIGALWLPIATFITLGLEHSVANMFILPLAQALGAPISTLDIATNITTVALGNAVGAGLLLGGVQKLSVFGPSAFE
eukprot:CAMPEP_0118930196 /NCGR_PEP_ID=MMETSP1169-20130426/6962_1 /TAXON_ID=36882 /ORGANISM="Pyramimonas obovata, Strain CCMP722" /LENGTH=345 /DNA_ID=CAMNT_0006872515 /DNA_START=33 /DNA_END=1067 /DNA_ORIENTATION=+